MKNERLGLKYKYVTKFWHFMNTSDRLPENEELVFVITNDGRCFFAVYHAEVRYQGGDTRCEFERIRDYVFNAESDSKYGASPMDSKDIFCLSSISSWISGKDLIP